MAPAPKYSPQEQEQLILDAAVNCIEQTSLMDFTMSAIAKAAGISMGSIYKHVQCKEDIIFALATRVYCHRQGVFAQVLALPITTPEKIIAITLLNPAKIKLYEFDSHLDSFATNELVISRTSPRWTEHMLTSHEKCEHAFYQCMHKAVTSGELTFEGDVEQMIEEINLGSWALTVGYQHVDRVVQIRQIAEGTDSLQEPVAIDSPIVNSLKRLINSYDWQQPLDIDGVAKVAKLLTKYSLR